VRVYGRALLNAVHSLEWGKQRNTDMGLLEIMKQGLWAWQDEIIWKPRRVLFFCGGCFQHRTTTCDVACIGEVGYGLRRKYEILEPQDGEMKWLTAHRCKEDKNG
jgi:hypothetical protein